MTYLNELDLRMIWDDWWLDHMDIKVTANEVVEELRKNNCDPSMEKEKQSLIQKFKSIQNMKQCDAEDYFHVIQKKLIAWGELTVSENVKNCHIMLE